MFRARPVVLERSGFGDLGFSAFWLQLDGLFCETLASSLGLRS